MSRDQLRASVIMFLVGFSIVLLILSLTVKKSAPYEQAKNVSVYAPATPVNYVPASSGGPASSIMPHGDTPGLSDDPDVPRYPGAVLISRSDSTMVHQLHYASTDRPIQIANYYADYASKKLGMVVNDYGELGSGAFGYHVSYSSTDKTSSLMVYAISQNGDLQSGGVQNPTYFNLLITGQMKILGQPSPTIPPAWLTPQTWGATAVTPTPRK